MSKHEKVACEVCGEMISSFPPAHKRHMNTHEAVTEEAPVVEETVVEPDKEEPKEEKKEVKSLGNANTLKNLDKASPAVKQLILEAMKKEEEFKEAPDAFVSSSTYDPHLELRRLYAPETLETVEYDANGIPRAKPGELHAYMADPNELKLTAQRGYTPVLDGHGQMVTGAGGSVLCTCPQEMYERIQAKNIEESKKRFANIEKGIGTAKSTGVDEAMDVDGVQITKE